MSVLPLMSASGLPGKRVEAYRAGMIAIALFIGFVLLLLFVWFCCLVVPCYSHAKGGCFYFGEGEMAMGRASVMVGSFAIIASSALYFFVVWFLIDGLPLRYDPVGGVIGCVVCKPVPNPFPYISVHVI